MLQITNYLPRYLAVRELISRTMRSTDITIVQYIKSIRNVSARSIYIAIIFSGFIPFAMAEVVVPTDEQLENLIQEAEQIEKDQAEAKRKAEAEKLKTEAIARQKAMEEKRRQEEAASEKAEADRKKAEAEARQKMQETTEQKAQTETEKEAIDSASTSKSTTTQANKEELFGDFVQIPEGTVVIQGNVIPVKSFKIARHAVTYEQWQKITGEPVPTDSNCGDCIVTKITRAQLQQFIDRLNNITKHKYRLPTSVEWIYACKMGNKEKNCNGNNIDASYIPITESTPVQSLGENEFGVIGMGDKIFEWTCSKYSEKYRPDYWNNCLSAQSNEYAAIHGRDKDIGTVEYNFLNSNLFSTTHKPAGTGFRLVLDQ